MLAIVLLVLAAVLMGASHHRADGTAPLWLFQGGVLTALAAFGMLLWALFRWLVPA